MGSRTLANDAKQIIALYSLSGVLALRTVAAQAPVVVVYGPGLHLHCVRSPDAQKNSLKRAKHSGRGGWGSGGASQTPVLGFPDSRSTLFFPSGSTHPNTPFKIQPLLY